MLSALTPGDLPPHPRHRDLTFSLKPTDSTSPLISEQLPHSCHTQNTQMVYWHKRAKNQYLNLLDCEVILVSVCFVLGFVCWVFLCFYSPSPPRLSHRTGPTLKRILPFFLEPAGRDELSLWGTTARSRDARGSHFGPVGSGQLNLEGGEQNTYKQQKNQQVRTEEMASVQPRGKEVAVRGASRPPRVTRGPPGRLQNFPPPTL